MHYLVTRRPMGQIFWQALQRRMTCDWGGLHNNRSSLQNELLVIDHAAQPRKLVFFYSLGSGLTAPGLLCTSIWVCGVGLALLSNV